jgi:hypothetical protein
MNNIKITSLLTVRVFAIYLVFYIGVAAFSAAILWVRLQIIDHNICKYILDNCKIGTSPGNVSHIFIHSTETTYESLQFKSYPHDTKIKVFLDVKPC